MSGWNVLRALALALLAALLFACATPAQRALAPPVPPTGPDIQAPASGEPLAPVVDAEPIDSAPASPWQRLRTQWAMAGCGHAGEVEREARRYTRNPRQFSASWQRAMPFLLLVLDEIERRRLPAEFALLPYVESHYTPIAANGDGPAGMWQLMPRTARERGLRVRRDLDERLDPIASTHAALDLIERYDREFGDWRLATMAFNAGEYRVKRELRKHRDAPLDDAQLARLDLSPITHQHLVRLLALACIVADPQRFAIELPDPEPSDVLVALDTAALDLRIAARLAGMPDAALQRFNAAHRGPRMADDAPQRLLVPGDRIASLSAALRDAAPAVHGPWRTLRASEPLRLPELAGSANVDSSLLAQVNGLDPDAVVAAGGRILVPGHDAEKIAEAQAVGTTPHIVAKGDSLWTIARRHGVRVADLLNWNALRANTILRPGMRLDVHAPAR